MPRLTSLVPVTTALALLAGAGCGADRPSHRPAARDVTAEVAAYYARMASPAGLHLARADLLSLGADPADAGAWVALVAAKGEAGSPPRPFADTLEVALRPGTDRAWTVEVRRLPPSAPVSPPEHR